MLFCEKVWHVIIFYHKNDFKKSPGRMLLAALNVNIFRRFLMILWKKVTKLRVYCRYKLTSKVRNFGENSFYHRRFTYINILKLDSYNCLFQTELYHLRRFSTSYNFYNSHSYRSLSKILAKIFWQFIVLLCNFDSPQANLV